MSDPNSAQASLDALDAAVLQARSPAEAASIQAQREALVNAMQGAPVGPDGSHDGMPVPASGLLDAPAAAPPGAFSPVSFGANPPGFDPPDAPVSVSDTAELPAPGPTLAEVQRMRATPSNTATHGTDGPSVASASRAYGVASAGVDDAIAKQQATLQQGIDDAHAQGAREGAFQAGQEKAYGEDALKAQALSEEKDAAVVANTKERDALVKETAAAQKEPLPKMPSDFLSALAIGLGAFGGSGRGGGNAALDVFHAKLDSEMATRAAKLGGLKGQLDSIDKAGDAIYRRFGSKDAALASMREIRLGQAKMKVEGWGRLDSNSQKAQNYAQMSDQIGTLQAEAKANAAAALVLQAQKGAKGNGRSVFDDYKDTLSVSKEGAAIAKTLDGLGEGGKSAVDDAFNKLPAGIQGSVLQANKLRGTLGSLRERAEAMMRTGKTVMPGSENLFNDPGTGLGNDLRRVFGPSGGSGLSDEHASFRADLQAMGRAKYLMEAGNAANQEGERKAAEEAVSGNLTMSNVLENIKRAEKSVANTTRQAYAQMTPTMVRELEARRKANLGATGDGYREGAAKPSPGSTVAGARRAGQ